MFTLNVSSQSSTQPLDWSLMHVSRSHHPVSYNTSPTIHWLPVRKRVMFKTVLLDLVWKCFNSTAPGYLSELCVPAASVSGRQHLRLASMGLATTSSQSPNDDRPAELRCRGTVSVEQSSGCSTETGDDTMHFQATTQDLSVPHLMCRRTEGTSTTARRCCGVFRDYGDGRKTADLLTY